MNLDFCKILFLILIINLAQSGCGLDYSQEEKARFRENEENWSFCYTNHFVFPADEQILGEDYLRCNIDGKPVLINTTNSLYRSIIYHISSGTITNPELNFDSLHNFKTKIEILFGENPKHKGFSLIIPYKLDSLNYFVQKALENTKITVAGPLNKNLPEFSVKTSCDPNGRVYFTSLQSSDSNQEINIDKFSYALIDGIWNYKLEYSFDEMEIVNGSKNFDHPYVMNSNVYVEKLTVRDFKCSIHFQLPQG